MFVNADLLLVLLVMLLSIASYHLAPIFAAIRKYSVKPSFRTNPWIMSLLLGFMFWLTHVTAVFSAGLPVSEKWFSFYLVLSFCLCSMIAVFSIRSGDTENFNTSAYFKTGFCMSAGIVMVDFIGYMVIFSDHLEIKPLLILFALLLSVAFSFSAVRLLLIALQDRAMNQSRSIRYRTAGSIIGGIALSGIPYVIMTSVLDFEFAEGGKYVYLLPFLFVFFLNFILTLIPDLYSHTMMYEQTKRIHEKEERFRSLFHQSPDAVISTDLEGTITSVNKIAGVMTQMNESELIGLRFLELIHKEDHQKVMHYFSEIVTGTLIDNDLSLKMKQKNGDDLDILITAVRQVVNNEVVGVYGVIKDITESKKAQTRINYLAYHDELTGLPNRRFFVQKLSEVIAKEKTFAVLSLDFDRFKRLNDLYGYAFGDQVFIKIAERLSAVLPERSFAARLGGDEFSVILLDVSLEEANELAHDMVHHFRLPMKVRGNDCLVTASIGASHYPTHSTDEELLLKYADIAMYDVKINGSNSWSIYTQEMNNKMIEKIKIENELRKAIQYGELTVYFQPKFKENLSTIIGAEALVRWNHKELGFIPPSTFIPIAEETGLIFDLERFVIGEVGKHVQLWERKNASFGRISINISHLHLYQDDLVQTIDDVLSDYNIRASSLELEITETAMMDNELEANMKLSLLRDRGIEISMDDFGTGYSSLSYLQKLNIDRLKIDQSFIKEMEHQNGNEAIVSMIISMAHHLNLKVIAEGVETLMQKELLSNLGCLEFQGYLGGRPIPADEFFAEYLASGKAS
ncbi:putative bifunctional diguanylate cyclase/phosphodiesterase [Metabacillus sp. JX24]|uniref:putative bifunctional diguanylate cyclase/phosphodiesterase n=1 Tax=Metabacillus sp. JX24 TaxID=3240759 RepID=UPI00350EA094